MMLTLPPMERTLLALQGLSVGDAFGQTFFQPEEEAWWRIQQRELAEAPWLLTDDTWMSLSVADCLRRFGTIDPDWLADSFAQRFDWNRGYGPSAQRYLRELQAGADWRELSRQQFDGAGSFGNGSAMRSAPIGAWFAYDLEKVREQARLAAPVTHIHPEGLAGAEAVAVAAAVTTTGIATNFGGFLEAVLDLVEPSEVRERIQQARKIGPDASVQLAVTALGNGTQLSCPDTVPFCLWNVARHLGHYEEALWGTVSGLGDRDTTCAIVGASWPFLPAWKPFPVTG